MGDRNIKNYSLITNAGYRDVQVACGSGQNGTITGSFGKSGKFRVAFPGGIAQQPTDSDKAISLVFKRFIKQLPS